MTKDVTPTCEAASRFFDLAPDLLCLLDGAGRLTVVNRAWTTTLGWTPGDLVGRPLSEFVHPDEVSVFDVPFELSRMSPIARAFENRVRDREGVWHVLEWSARPMPEEKLVYCAARDVTATRDAQRALAESREKFLEAQRLEALGRLAAGVAHDFNNLLTIIGGFAGVVAESLDPADPRREPMGEIDRAVVSAGRLTSQLLAFARRQPSRKRVVDLAAAVRDSARMLRRLLDERVRLDLDIPHEPAGVLLDPGQLDQVLVNLVVNARDAIAGTGTIEVAVHASPQGHTLEVRDDGCGMDVETQRRLFEPFFSTKGVKGTGLGLAAVWGIVEDSGGNVQVESAPGRGSRFRIRWPAHKIEPPEGRTSTRKRAHRSGGTGLALVVDDHPLARKLMVAALTQSGWRVQSAESAETAEDLAADEKRYFDLLVTDVRMPGRSGVELARRLRERRPSLAVVIVSGLPVSGDLAAESLPDDAVYLPKPFSLDELRLAIREALAKVEQE